MKRKKYPLSVGWDYAMEGGGGGTEAYAVGDDDPLCQQLKGYMNHVARNWVLEREVLLNNYCAPMARIAPIFSEPPWTELDPRKHEELIARLIRYRDEGADRYFSPEPWEFRRDDSYYRKKVRDFINSGGRLQYWKTRLKETFDDPVEQKNKPVPPGDQHIIQLRYMVGTYPEDLAATRAMQKECKAPDWRSNYFFVTQDLSGPAQVRDFVTDSSLLIYVDDPVLVRTGADEISVYSPQNLHYCRLTYPDKFKQGK
jgi:hypothetical protein